MELSAQEAQKVSVMEVPVELLRPGEPGAKVESKNFGIRDERVSARGAELINDYGSNHVVKPHAR